MNKEMTSEAEGDEEILTCDIPDDALERAASAEQTAFTLFYCTSQSSSVVCGISVLAQQFRQLGDVRRDPPRLICAELSINRNRTGKSGLSPRATQPNAREAERPTGLLQWPQQSLASSPAAFRSRGWRPCAISSSRPSRSMMSPPLIARILCSSTCIRSRSSSYQRSGILRSFHMLAPAGSVGSSHDLKSFGR